MQIHINIVSHQLIANILPTLIDEQSNLVVLVYTANDPAISDKKKTLERFYKQRSIKVVKTVELSSQTEYDQLLSQAETLATDLQSEYPASQILLNATGGTKPMTLAFAEAFNRLLPNNSFSLYTDTHNRCISILSKQGGSLPFTSTLSLKDYLQIHDFEVKSGLILNKNIPNQPSEYQDVQTRKNLTQWLAANLTNRHQYEQSFLNAMATRSLPSKFNNHSFQPTQSIDASKRKPSPEFLEQLLQHNMISSFDENHITFSSEQSARYLGGIWLEEYAFLEAQAAGAHYIGLSVDGRWKNTNSTVKNEFDLLVVHYNQILVIECKTANISDAGKGQEIINKLNALSKKLYGPFGQSLLLSTQKAQPETVDRAKLEKIDVLAAKSVTHLRDSISKWMVRVAPPER